MQEVRKVEHHVRRDGRVGAHLLGDDLVHDACLGAQYLVRIRVRVRVRVRVKVRVRVRVWVRVRVKVRVSLPHDVRLGAGEDVPPVVQQRRLHSKEEQSRVRV